MMSFVGLTPDTWFGRILFNINLWLLKRPKHSNHKKMKFLNLRQIFSSSDPAQINSRCVFICDHLCAVNIRHYMSPAPRCVGDTQLRHRFVAHNGPVPGQGSGAITRQGTRGHRDTQRSGVRHCDPGLCQLQIRNKFSSQDTRQDLWISLTIFPIQIPNNSQREFWLRRSVITWATEEPICKLGVDPNNLQLQV